MRIELATRIFILSALYWFYNYSSFFSSRTWDYIDQILSSKREDPLGLNQYKIFRAWDTFQFYLLYLPRKALILMLCLIIVKTSQQFYRDVTRKGDDINTTDGLVIGRLSPFTNVVYIYLLIVFGQYLVRLRSLFLIAFLLMHLYVTSNNIYFISAMLECIPDFALIVWNVFLFILLIPFAWIPEWTMLHNLWRHQLSTDTFLHDMITLLDSQRNATRLSLRSLMHFWKQKYKFIRIENAVSIYNERVFEVEWMMDMAWIDTPQYMLMGHDRYMKRSGLKLIHHILFSVFDSYTIDQASLYHARIALFDMSRAEYTDFEPVFSPELLKQLVKQFKAPVFCVSYKHTRRGNEDVDGLNRDKQRVRNCISNICNAMNLGHVLFWCDLVYPTSDSDIITSVRGFHGHKKE